MAPTLSEAIANAYLFAGDAKTDSKGLVRVWLHPKVTQFESYDDYIYLTQAVENDYSGPPAIFFLEKKALKEAGEEGFMELALTGCQEVGPGELFQSLLESLMDFPTADLRGFTFPSDRFGKISRIKGDEPCVITLGMDQGMKLARFTKGPSVQGMMAFLEEE